jgi:hypothetical protein
VTLSSPSVQSIDWITSKHSPEPPEPPEPPEAEDGEALETLTRKTGLPSEV